MSREGVVLNFALGFSVIVSPILIFSPGVMVLDSRANPASFQPLATDRPVDASQGCMYISCAQCSAMQFFLSRSVRRVMDGDLCRRISRNEQHDSCDECHVQDSVYTIRTKCCVV